MPDPPLLPVPLASTEQCHALSVSDVEPPFNEDPVPDPDHEADPPLGDPGSLTALIIATCDPPAPDTSSPPNLSPEDEPLVDQPSLGDQELASPDAEVGTALAPVVAAAEVGSPPVASEVTPDLTPASPSGLSPEPVPSSPPRTDIGLTGTQRRRRGGRESSSCQSHELILALVPPQHSTFPS